MLPISRVDQGLSPVFVFERTPLSLHHSAISILHVSETLSLMAPYPTRLTNVVIVHQRCRTSRNSSSQKLSLSKPHVLMCLSRWQFCHHPSCKCLACPASPAPLPLHGPSLFLAPEQVCGKGCNDSKQLVNGTQGLNGSKAGMPLRNITHLLQCWAAGTGLQVATSISTQTQ